MLRRVNVVFVLCLVVFIASGMLFIKAKRDEKIVSVMENLKDKTIALYSSNFNKMYIKPQTTTAREMDTLCAEGDTLLKGKGINSVQFIIEDGVSDPYSLSEVYLRKNLKEDTKYILIDMTRSQERHGSKYKVGDVEYCPISIIVSKKSNNYERSHLFSSRLKAEINSKYKDIPVEIITVENQDYNQSMGYMGILLEIGDASNTIEQARGSLKIFIDALVKVVND